MALVADASVILAWAFEEQFANAETTLQRVRREALFVPAIWWFEVRNVLVLKERGGRRSEQQNASFLQTLSHLAVRIDDIPDEAAVLTLARRHGLTVYDAAYLELAQREGLDLATLDIALADAARAEGVPLVG
ncbi:MAG TPA: type II toxin-antitoxin system VapC family toxin [Stellaceae bacterium]|jgi:predicted nucleic acid-binding protein|nr:type II toxin-antitoxin system VapC family toxin [Stellaceae bacterium]